MSQPAKKELHDPATDQKLKFAFSNFQTWNAKALEFNFLSKYVEAVSWSGTVSAG